jgi:pterin-4a-carbinolamine dehydratase
MRYRELVETVARRAGVSTDVARDATEATIDTLARTLEDPQRTLLLDRVPGKIKENSEAPGPAPDVGSFVAEVSWLLGVEEPLARYRAQAVLSGVAQQEPDLILQLRVPDSLQELFEEPPGARGPALTDVEILQALERLPYWSGDEHSLWRFLVLPPHSLDLVLARLAGMKAESGRAPHIDRRAKDAAVLIVRTHSVNAVTALDVELAHRVDEIIG